MVNKLLIALGIAAVVAVGTVGAWKLSGAERRVGALGPLEKPVPLAWRGSWSPEAEYQPGQVVSFENSSYVAEAATAGEAPNAKEGPWALMAAQAASGGFSGTLQSPNGSYSLVVADDGIVIQGPGGSIKLRDTTLEVRANQSLLALAGAGLTLESGATSTFRSGAQMDVRGATVRLNCGSGGGSRVARMGDPVVGTAPAGGGGVNSQIVQGSPTVLAC